MPGSNIVFQQAASRARAGSTAQQPQNPTGTAGLTKTHGGSATGPMIALGLFAALVIAYGVWMYLSGERLKEGVKKILPNLHNILVVTVSAIIGIVLLKLAFVRADQDAKKSNIAIVQWLDKWVLHPIALLLGFV